MSNRHLSRSIVLQTLFECDFDSAKQDGGQEKPDVPKTFEKNLKEFAPGSNDRPFMENLLQTVLKKKGELDNIIEKAAPDWPIEKIAVVDRNILRMGLAELLFADRNEVPAKVAINEAIELGKQFGGDNSGRFVNGVLGAVYKEMGEPGKNDKPKPKKKYANVPLDQLPVIRMAGAVVYAKNDGQIYLALVHDVFGHWTLPKGKIGDKPEIANETTEEGLIREVKEEIGLDIELKEPLGNNAYSTYHPEKGKVLKKVSYFLAEGEFKDLTLEYKEEKGGLDDVRWFKLSDILDLNFYDDILPIVTKAITKLAEQANQQPTTNNSQKNA